MEQPGNRNITILNVSKLQEAFDVIKNSVVFDGDYNEVKQRVEALCSMELAINQINDLQIIIVDLHNRSQQENTLKEVEL